MRSIIMIWRGGLWLKQPNTYGRPFWPPPQTDCEWKALGAAFCAGPRSERGARKLDLVTVAEAFNPGRSAAVQGLDGGGVGAVDRRMLSGRLA